MRGCLLLALGLWLVAGSTAQAISQDVSVTATANTSTPTVAHSSAMAQVVDFTTGSATTAAFTHLSFGLDLGSPWLTVAIFSIPKNRDLFAQSIRNVVPDAVVASQALPATSGILVRVTVRFTAKNASAPADTLVKYLTDASLLRRMLPEASWRPRLAYTTFPYLASAVVQPVGGTLERLPCLHFSVRVPGTRKASFDAQKLAPWRAALRAALPGLADKNLTVSTTESTARLPGGRYPFQTRTDTLVHARVTGPALQALRQLAPKLLTSPQAIWSRRTFGAVEAVPASWVVVAFTASQGLKCPTIANCKTVSTADCKCVQCTSGFDTCSATGPACATNVRNSTSHCGGCGKACAPSKICQSGSCVCPAGQYDCNGVCIANTGCCTNVKAACPADNKLCKCGTTYFCPADKGTCTCKQGLTECSAACVDLNTDDKNCGACGKACGSGQACRNGFCACPIGSNLEQVLKTCIPDVVAAGWNSQGQLGDGTQGNQQTSPVPVAVAGDIEFVTGLAAGEEHSCVVQDYGAKPTLCWGSAASGRLGDGTALFGSVCAGVAHTCGMVTGTTTAACFGAGDSFQLGSGTTANSSKPVQFSDGTPSLDFGFDSVACGAQHTCGLRLDGQVVCFGSNNRGQCGTAANPTRAPTVIAGGVEFRTITAGGQHTCGLRASDDRAMCWGLGIALGNGAQADSATPVEVSGGFAFTRIAAGGQHACGIRGNDGRMLCWGANSAGQLGDGTTSPRLTPTPVAGNRAYLDVTAGADYTCGLLLDSRVVCFGGNSRGQLGDGTTINRATPTFAARQLKFRAVGSGPSASHTLFLLPEGS